MGQVNACGLNKFVAVEEHVVIPIRTLERCRVADVIEFGDVNGFGGVDDAVFIIVVLTGAVFVVVVPLGVNETVVVLSCVGIVNRHGHVITRVDVA